MTTRTKYMLLSGLLLGGIYLYLFSFASAGYGYMGYNGYNNGPSFWYWGGHHTYYDRSLRSGSISGTGRRGGGPGSGK